MDPSQPISQSFDISPYNHIHEFPDLNETEGDNFFHTPNGTTFWCPDVNSHLKPVVGTTFNNWEEVVLFYKNYALKAGFSVKKGQTKRWKDVVTHKYLRCNKAGKPQGKHKFDTLCETSLNMRQSTFTVTDCPASIMIQVCEQTSVYNVLKFCENHNHPLVEDYHRDLSKISRKLTFSTQQFIHQMSLNKIGPTIAHRLQVSIKGGHHNVNGTPTDIKNWYKSMRIYIGDRDSQLILDRLKDRFENLPDFYFDFVVEKGRLKSVFWVDEISKLSYQEFGDVLAFDVTYKTNKYNMIFVPFTGVDNNKRCVTFGAGLLSNETIESYKWLLQAFIKAHRKQPQLVLSDQDPAMKQAISQVFTQSRHRLCMWHIMKKLPSKISSDLLDNTNIRARIHRLVWNVFIKPSTFEDRWHLMMEEFGLQEHGRLKEMYAIRDEWVPAYFRDIPMCCLMKTTSRFESSNASFKVNSSCANTLVQFMLCFETRMDSQRYMQRLCGYKTYEVTFKDETGLPIEKHAFDLYTHNIFVEVRKEIFKGKFFCYVSGTEEVDGLHIFSVTHLDKKHDVTNIFTVKYDIKDHSSSCSCRGFTRLGYLCRHIFCVFRVKKVDQIPSQYVSKRWTRDVLPKHIWDTRYQYGVDNSGCSVLRHQIFELISECVDALRADPNGLASVANDIRNLKSRTLEGPMNVTTSIQTKTTVIEQLIGQPLRLDSEVAVENPDVIRNKGTGHVHRIVGEAEKQIERSQKPLRLCNKCKLYVNDHDSRNCEKVRLKKLEAEKKERMQKSSGWKSGT